MELLLSHSFLTLSLLLSFPAMALWGLRPDLRRMMGRVALWSLPFALTERLFYPDYWQPRFLFDLVNVIGFGFEDIIFVTSLGVFVTSCWPVATGQHLTPMAGAAPVARRAAMLLAGCGVATALLAWVGVPMIWGAPVLMVAFGMGICADRPDLVPAAFGGAYLTTLVYSSLCILLGALIPGVFQLDWNAERFSNVYMLGVPLEELLYGCAAGFVGAVFYPWAAKERLERKE